jgi:hypothetical protein
VVEGTGLENRHTGEPGIESSNLSLSVLYALRTPHGAQLCAVRVGEWLGVARRKMMLGRVAEWFKAHAWKVCVR